VQFFLGQPVTVEDFVTGPLDFITHISKREGSLWFSPGEGIHNNNRGRRDGTK
jgi:hypothetical protein